MKRSLLIVGLAACKKHISLFFFRGTELPDPVRLFEPEGAGNTNIVRYQRRGQGVQIPAPGTPSEVIFIDENTPVPSIPSYSPARQRPGDVLYIGPE